MAIRLRDLVRNAHRTDAGSAEVARARRAGLLVVREAPFNAETGPAALRHRVTPAASRFVRTNFDVPELDARSHSVAVGGAVERPFALRVEELRAMPHCTLTVTTECAGNHRTSMSPLPRGEPWHGGAVSTGRWTGVILRDLLDRARLLPSCVEVLTSGADGDERRSYQRSLPLETALRPDVLLAWRLNGRPIPARHGAPLRLVVPGWYGMASVKWVARIDALTLPFSGYFQTERYVYRERDKAVQPVTEIRVKSIFVSPAPWSAVRMGKVRVRGLAWSGRAPISRVEVADSTGSAFSPVRLVGPAECHAWRAWEVLWTPPHRGRHVLRCRATDEAGNVQPDAPVWNELGYGANGVQSLTLEVR